MLKTTTFHGVTRFDLARTLVGRGRYWTCAYLVDGVLIDSGCAHTARELADWLQGRRVDWLINTHSHEDHIGGNARLQDEQQGLEIRVHPLALPVLANPAQEQPLHPYRRLLWGYPRPCRAREVQDGEVIETERYRFQVIYTPGHSPDHLCLYEQIHGWLFSGDLFVGGWDRALGAGYDIWQIIASLKRMAVLPLAVLFPGSARVRQNPRQDLLDKIHYLEESGAKVLQMHRRGAPPGQIARALFGAPMPVEFITLGHFSRRNLVCAFLRPRAG